MDEFLMSSVFDVATQQITINDTTGYPVVWRGDNYLETELSYSLFSSTDEFSSNASVDITDPSNREWIITAITPNAYKVKMFCVLRYNAQLTNVIITPLTIATDGGKLYIYNPPNDSTSVTFATSQPGVDPHWKEIKIGNALNLTVHGGSNYASLTAIDIYNIFELSDDKANIVGWALNDVITSDQEYNIEKTDCNTWSIEYLYGLKTIDTVELLDYNGDLLETITPAVNVVNVDLTEYGDGAYIVKITFTDDSISYVTLYEICEAQACYKQLVKYLLCSCNDPCDDCDDNISRMADLNSLLTLFEALKEMIYLERYQYLGIYTLSDTRDQMITEVGTMIEKLKIITDRCGLCDEDEDNTITC